MRFWVLLGLHNSVSTLLQVVTQLLSKTWVAQFSQGFDFDLTNALPCHTKFSAYFFECPAMSVLKAKAQL
jgi:hypothetical protein